MQERDRLSQILNPRDIPGDPRCEKIDLDDPVTAARARIALGDLRPFMVGGFVAHPSAPGIQCQEEVYGTLPARGGAFVSDIPDVCGGQRSFQHASTDDMRAYNVIIASQTRFQQATGCKVFDVCEEKYGDGHYANAVDGSCLSHPGLMKGLAAGGTPAMLREVLTNFSKAKAADRDALTEAYVNALGRAKWQNANLLLDAGADANGRLSTGGWTKQAPLAATYNQNVDKGTLINARALAARGLRPVHPASANALAWAASKDQPDADVSYLLGIGISPNAKMESGLPGSTPFEMTIIHIQTRYGREEDARPGRRMAVRLFMEGGELPDNTQATSNDNRAIASLKLAWAHRHGKLPEMLDSMRKQYGYIRYDEHGMKQYIDIVGACSAYRPRPAGDHMVICANGVL